MAHVDEQAHRVIPSLQGRLSHICGANRLPHLWGLLVDTDPVGTPLGMLPFDTDQQLIVSCGGPGTALCNPCTPGLFIISATAVQLQRLSTDSLLPLPDTAYAQNPPSAVPITRSRRTYAKLMVMANAGVDERRFYMDANQSIQINAEAVNVSWVAPANWVNLQGVVDRTAESLRRTGVVIDAFLGAGISRIEAGAGALETVTYTTHLSVAGIDASRVVEVPPYAQSVTIYQAQNLGTASTFWRSFYGNPDDGTGVEVGQIPFIPGQRKTQPGIDLGDVTHLQADADVSDRFYTLVWKIRP